MIQIQTGNKNHIKSLIFTKTKGVQAARAKKITPEDFSQYLFWDIDRSKLNLDEKARFVIGRVVMYGMIGDWNLIKAYYGLDHIQQKMLQERYLDKKSLSFLSCIFDIPKEQFRCYTEQQSTQIHWNF